MSSSTKKIDGNRFKGKDCSNLDMRKKESKEIMQILIETGICPCCDKRIHEGLKTSGDKR